MWLISYTTSLISTLIHYDGTSLKKFTSPPRPQPPASRYLEEFGSKLNWNSGFTCALKLGRQNVHVVRCYIKWIRPMPLFCTFRRGKERNLFSICEKTCLVALESCLRKRSAIDESCVDFGLVLVNGMTVVFILTVIFVQVGFWGKLCLGVFQRWLRIPTPSEK